MRDRAGLRERAQSLNGYSQYGEEAVILETFKALGIEKGHLVDLGAGDGYTMSNTRALLDMGWTGDLYDGDPKGAKDVKKIWLTQDSITSVVFYGLQQRDLGDFEYLNIDIDGNDYHILHRLLWKGWMPLLITAEINPIFKRDEAVVMSYNEAHIWGNDTYYGMSLAACERLAKEFGYTLIHLHQGINAFLLRNDHAQARPELIRPIEYRQKFDHRPHPKHKQWIRL